MPRRRLAEWGRLQDLYGSSIALANRWLDPSLFAHLIPYEGSARLVDLAPVRGIEWGKRFSIVVEMGSQSNRLWYMDLSHNLTLRLLRGSGAGTAPLRNGSVDTLECINGCRPILLTYRSSGAGTRGI